MWEIYISTQHQTILQRSLCMNLSKIIVSSVVLIGSALIGYATITLLIKVPKKSKCPAQDPQAATAC